MYYSYYGLQDNPFDLAPNGSYVYMSETHKEALATLRYGVIANKGFLLLTGGVGVGKTTLLNALLKMVQNKVNVCVLNNPTLTKKEFFHYVASQFSLPYKNNKSIFIINFKKLLARCEEKEEKLLLVIDEAQAFPIDLLEEIRLLSNLAGESNVLGIFLVGQPEIREQLATSQLLPLRQRIGIRYHIEPLSAKDTQKYIYYRLNRAGGGKASIFTEHAIETIHEASLGNPRLINILCDYAMLSGFARDLLSIDKALVLECINEIRLPDEATLQTSDILKRERQNAIEYLSQSDLQIGEVAMPPPQEQVSEIDRQQESYSSERGDQPSKNSRPMVHFMIVLLIMSVIFVLGIMIPSETINLFSGAE